MGTRDDEYDYLFKGKAFSRLRKAVYLLLCHGY